MVEIDINYTYGAQALEGIRIQELAAFTLEHEGLPDNTAVSISFVDDQAIAQLNEKYRGVVGPTDVLSFECDGVDDVMLLDEEDEFEEPEYELGDIVIAPDVAQRQTQEYGTTFEQEITLLLVHGLLHLCGYDHIEDDEAEEMEARERMVLSEWYGYEVSFR